MNFLIFSNQWSLRSRLMLIGLVALLMGLLPSCLLLNQYVIQLSAVAREAQGLPINLAWQDSLTALQTHRRLAAEALSTRPGARSELAASQQAVRAKLQVLVVALGEPGAGFAARHGAAASALTEQFNALTAELDGERPEVAKLLTRHLSLASLAFRAVADFNGDMGLLLDPEAETYFAIIAGLQAAPQVSDALSELGSLASAAAVDDIAAVSAALTRYREHAGLTLQSMQAAERTGGPMQQTWTSLSAQMEKQRRLVDDSTRAAAQDVNYPLEQLAASFSTAAQLQAEVSAQAMAALKSDLNQRHSQATSRRNLLLLLLPALVAALALLMRRSMRQLLTPVAQMVTVTERIAGGDLSQNVPLGRRDEMGRVLLSMDHMQQRLRHLVEQIHTGADNIHVAAEEIAGGNQDLATRTETAAAHLQQTTSNVEQLEQAVQQSNRAASDARGLAATASALALDGGHVVGQVVSTMRAIDEASGRIADIIGLIDGIAFQTNILALNAAVEAARAGEQGRGFAVVASEVRALAGRSAEAAKEIKGLIQRSVERVESGTELASKAGVAMQQIVAKVQQVSQVIEGMDEHVKTQAQQTQALAAAVRAFDAMTQQNAALVEQSAAAAESLRGQAQSMDATVQAFRL
jgi:methyl-accepting chemotaxis protein